MKTLNYHIPAISCDHCVMTIKRELNDLKGIHTVNADPVTKDVSITFESPVTQEAIESLLEEIGYPVEK